jgi:exopolyphosphatase / guanosine-5'-triphosphate,3'-diphosphate pyrophosphatase
VTALGEGARASGRLAPERMDATLAALKEAFAAAERLGARRVVAAATMAVRIATNAEEFLERAHAQGTPVQVLSGDREAQLGFESVANDPQFGSETRLSIVDVGGHSTEIATASRIETGWSVELRRSYALGTLALRGAVLAAEAPTPPDVLRAVAEIDDAIGLAYLPGRCGRVVALGATGTNLVTIREEMTEWDPERVHGAYLDYEDVGKAAGWMMRMTDAERAAIVGIEPGRERSIHIGALLLERFLHALRAEGCSVSVRGWRHALLEGMPN